MIYVSAYLKALFVILHTTYIFPASGNYWSADALSIGFLTGMYVLSGIIDNEFTAAMLRIYVS